MLLNTAAMSNHIRIAQLLLVNCTETRSAPNQHCSQQFNQSLMQTYLKVSAECQLKGAGTLLHVALVQGQTCHQQMGLNRVAVMADAPLQ